LRAAVQQARTRTALADPKRAASHRWLPTFLFYATASLPAEFPDGVPRNSFPTVRILPLVWIEGMA